MVEERSEPNHRDAKRALISAVKTESADILSTCMSVLIYCMLTCIPVRDRPYQQKSCCECIYETHVCL